MEKIEFGPSGNSNLFYSKGFKSSVQAPSWIKSLGLNAFEYSFGKGYLMGEETAILLGEEAKRNGVSISVHAPYYINFANESVEMAEKSFQYVLRGLKYLKLMGGKHLVFHCASQGKLEREDALLLVKKRLVELVSRVKKEGFLAEDFKLCPETMGKPMQIGTYKEIVDLCMIDEIFVPTFDFGHIYALNLGNFGSYEDFREVFEYAIRKLGFERVKNCHIHFSKIEYGKKGEIRHLNFDDNNFGPNFLPLLQAIKDLGLCPMIICESRSNMDVDALEMKNAFEKI